MERKFVYVIEVEDISTRDRDPVSYCFTYETLTYYGNNVPDNVVVSLCTGIVSPENVDIISNHLSDIHIID